MPVLRRCNRTQHPRPLGWVTETTSSPGATDLAI